MYNFAIIKLLKMHKFCFPAEICKKRFHFASIYVIIRRSTEKIDGMTGNCAKPVHKRRCQIFRCGETQIKVGFHEQIQKTRFEYADICDRLIRFQDSAPAADAALYGKHQPRRQQHEGAAGTDRKLSDSDHYFFHCRCSHSLRH